MFFLHNAHKKQTAKNHYPPTHNSNKNWLVDIYAKSFRIVRVCLCAVVPVQMCARVFWHCENTCFAFCSNVTGFETFKQCYVSSFVVVCFAVFDMEQIQGEVLPPSLPREGLQR